MTHTIKTIILGILTTLAALLGGLMEFISPSFFHNIKDGVQSMLSFLGEQATHAATIIFFIFSGISLGYPILRKILDVCINTVLGVADPALHMSDREINKWVERFPEEQRTDMAHRLRGIVELFNGRFTQADGQYDGFQHSGDYRYILKAFENLRIGKVSTCRKSIGAQIAKLEESILANPTPEKQAQMRVLRHAMNDLYALEPDLEAGRNRLAA